MNDSLPNARTASAFDALELRLKIKRYEESSSTPEVKQNYAAWCEQRRFLYYAYDTYYKMTGINLRPAVEEDDY